MLFIFIPELQKEMDQSWKNGNKNITNHAISKVMTYINELLLLIDLYAMQAEPEKHYFSFITTNLLLNVAAPTVVWFGFQRGLVFTGYLAFFTR